MNVYLVGGAVRDKLLNIPSRDHDHVVTDVTPEALKELGYEEVGKSHTIFLHPVTKEEYTLCQNLSDDLKRRDLTINAMALKNEILIDEVSGFNDLQNKILRSVKDENFFTDPLRVYRVARFQAQFPEFKIHQDTLELMKSVSKTPEFKNLDPERLFSEVRKALNLPRSELFFHVLFQTQIIPIHFNHLEPVDLKYLSGPVNEKLKFASLFLRHQNNEIEKLCDSLKVPNDWKERALLAGKIVSETERLNLPEDIVSFFSDRDVYRRPSRIMFMNELLNLIGRNDLVKKLTKWFDITRVVTYEDVSKDLSGKEIGDEIRKMRIEILRNDQG